ncbi:hypothetical protein [Streptomyces violascens]|uniref:hypothetical protein n=1 Tax=Streptomyces violascens TaxID=67381 RepID=UPI0036ACB8AB
MSTITCASCAKAQFRAQSDGTFKCDGCETILTVAEISLDDLEVWTVGPEGHLGYTTDPAVALQDMAEAVEEFLTTDTPYGQSMALENYEAALSCLLDAQKAGIKIPRASFTREQVSDAINQGADVILDALSLGEPETDAINLVVNAALTCLTAPGSSFEDVLRENYGNETAEEVRSWWGWGQYL